MTDSAYQQQLKEKTSHIRRLFAPLDMPEWEIFDSPAQHYRMRAEFRVWHEGGAMFYAMFEPGQKAGGASLIRCDSFAPACGAINTLMPRLLEAAGREDILKNRWYQVEFLATLSGEMLVTMVYHKKLDEAWEAAARRLQEHLGIALIGRSRGQKIVLQRDFVTEKLRVHGETFVYRQYEGSFTQPNAVVCEKMLAWACGVAQPLGGSLLELYCGNGNFTLPLARRFDKVLATEVSKTSVAAALWNIGANGSGNVKIVRLSAEEFSEAYAGVRTFRRLQEQGVELADYRFSTIFVDPPRAGVDAETLKLVRQFDNVVYISCNPETLRANLDFLAQTHTPRRAALFDQFPFTRHIECGVWLQKKKQMPPRKPFSSRNLPMPAQTHRVNHDPAFLLTAKPWRENSLWLEMFSRRYGRVALLARSARARQSELRGVLVPFVPVSASWYGSQELKTLHRAEWLGGWRQPQGRALFSGLYANELLYRLTAREDPHPALYDALAEVMQAVSAQAEHQAALRRFEWTLLTELGFAPDLQQDENGRAIGAGQTYWLRPEHAPLPLAEAGGLPAAEAKGVAVEGSTLIQLRNGVFDNGESLQQTLKLTRLLLDFRLPEGIKSRQVLQQMQAFQAFQTA